MSENTVSGVDATTIVEPAAGNAKPNSHYFVSAMSALALIISGYMAFKLYRPVEQPGACYRIIDMQKLNKSVVADLMNKTENQQPAEAGNLYRSKLSALDDSVSRHADGCLVIRRDVIAMPDDSVDITASVAKDAGIDLNAKWQDHLPHVGDGINPFGSTNSSASSPAPQKSTATPNELSAKLD